jgi:processive 1,2-diacylglycerol beta-glucosyltransferase
MRKARRILVLTLSFGSGHVQAARAIAQELGHQSSDVEVLVVDALANARLFFRAGYVWSYWALVRYAPTLWDRFFKRRTARMSRHTAPEWAFHWGCPQLFKTITRFRPDTIIATEVAACEMAAMAKREGLTEARIVNVITDYEAEPVWVKPEVDVYAVADKHVHDQLCAWGASPHSIVRCGIPTDPAFYIQHDEKRTRERYDLHEQRPIVLVMGGGEGPTHMNEVTAILCASSESLHVIAVTGFDRRARRKLAGVRPLPAVSLRVLGWTNDIAALMQAASVLVTKPGGLTTAEAAACALPVVMFDAIPGPERRNAARLTEVGAGISASGAPEAAAAVLALLKDENARCRMSANAKRLARPDAAAAIARLALDETLPAKESARRMTA